MNYDFYRSTVLVLALLLCANLPAQRIGDPGYEFDESRDDPRFPAMREWATAGVTGGIPFREDLTLRSTLTADATDNDRSDDIQAALDQAAQQGGGVVLLAAGTFPLRSALTLPSNVVLRGSGKGVTVIESFLRFRGTSSAQKIPTFHFQDAQRAGLEDFTVIFNADYNGQEMFPLDVDFPTDVFIAYEFRSQNYQNERVYHDRPNYQFHDELELYVDFVRFDGASTNCWIDNCDFLKSGSNGIVIPPDASHITIRDTRVEGAFNKGGNGNGYGINCSGDYVLMVRDTVKRVRHWAIQQGAQYNVVLDCYSWADMNFHQNDDGDNLIQNTKIHIPQYHLWRAFQRGASFHGDPGPRNLFFANDVIDRSAGPSYTDQSVIYTWNTADNETVIPLPGGDYPPAHGTLYAVRQAVTVLPVTYSSPLTLQANHKRHRLRWTFATVTDLRRLTLERGFATGAFQSLADLSFTNGATEVAYNYSVRATSGAHYRLRIEDLDGTVTYSNVVAAADRDGPALLISSNPGSVRVLFTNAAAPWRLVDLNGRQVARGNGQTDGILELSALGVPTGVYVLQFGGQTHRLIYR